MHDRPEGLLKELISDELLGALVMSYTLGRMENGLDPYHEAGGKELGTILLWAGKVMLDVSVLQGIQRGEITPFMEDGQIRFRPAGPRPVAPAVPTGGGGSGSQEP